VTDADATTGRQADIAFGKEPITPRPDRLRVDLEPFRRRLDRPTIFQDASDHAPSPFACQRRVRMLGSR